MTETPAGLEHRSAKDGGGPDGSGLNVNLQIVAVGLGALAAALAQTLIIPVLPTLTADLHTSTGNAQWLLTATLLVAAVSVPVLGRFADMFGRRLVLLVSLGGLAVGSVIDALTSDFGVMLVGRAVAGLSAASIPLGISLLAIVLPAERRGSATALTSAMLGIGSALGLPLAGLIGDNADYHVLYWIGAGGAVVSGVLIAALVAEPPAARERSIDWAGIALLAVGLTCLILGISQGSSWGWGSGRILGLFAVAVVALAALTRVELRVTNPLIDMSALARPPIALTNIAGMFVGFALFASFTGTSSYVQAPEATGYGFGSTILTAGLCLLPSGLLMLVLAPIAARFIGSWGPARVLALGGAVIAAGLVFRIVAVDSLWEVVVGTSVVGAGTGVGYAALPSLINHHTPAAQLAAANGINALARSLGSSLASAVGGALLTAITMNVGGHELPSLGAYRVLFAVCAGAALLASAVGLTISAGVLTREPDGSGGAEPAPEA
ncbi:MFS transporter [Streptomyces sp. NPDC008150]|uniref:MFS transporter n=1 Tax=Streptomyces sp. NPDC008150 TaxID=3364816 RepID=UPI0036EC7576